MVTKRRALGAALIFGLLSLAGSVAAVTTMAGGPISEFRGVQVGPPDIACTSSTEFESMPGMTLPFRLSKRGRVVVMFQGQFGEGDSTAGARAGIRLTIDGVVVGSAVAVGNDHGDGLQTFGYNAFSGRLGVGDHTAQVLWHTYPDGATSCVEERSLITLQP